MVNWVGFIQIRSLLHNWWKSFKKEGWHIVLILVCLGIKNDSQKNEKKCSNFPSHFVSFCYVPNFSKICLDKQTKSTKESNQVQEQLPITKCVIYQE